jgi:hypothetical protein
LHIIDARYTYLVASLVTVLLVAPWTAPEADAQALPAGWSIRDIGNPTTPGNATFVSPTLTATSRGFDINGTKDQFTFAYASIRGDVTLIARVATLSAVDPGTLAGLMIRNGTGSGARHIGVFATPAQGVIARHRSSNGGSTTQTAGGAGTAPVWLKLERRSNTYTAYRSPNGTSWTVIHSVTISMSSSTLVGFAVASHSKTASVITGFDGISVNGTGWTVGNAPPAVSLTSPTGGSSFLSPATIALAATASDTDGTIAKVDFYSGTTLLGTDVTSPYTFSWTGVTTGSYGVKAIATDNRGTATTSATANITVGTNAAPTVSLTSPSQGASFVLPASITLSASASDSDGSIQRVDFYLGALLVGTDSTSPYSIIWPALLGSHSVSAVATDNRGAQTVSAWRDFTVTATATLSKAVFRPASPTDAVDYYRFEVFAAGANPNTATPIATQNIGLPPVIAGECSADVQATLVTLTPGNYIATVAGVGSGGTLRSNTFAFTR